MPERIWWCKIGTLDGRIEPDGADLPMRNAVRGRFYDLMGAYPDFIFSGWGGHLSATQRTIANEAISGPIHEAHAIGPETLLFARTPVARQREEVERLNARAHEMTARIETLRERIRVLERGSNDVGLDLTQVPALGDQIPVTVTRIDGIEPRRLMWRGREFVPAAMLFRTDRTDRTVQTARVGSVAPPPSLDASEWARLFATNYAISHMEIPLREWFADALGRGIEEGQARVDWRRADPTLTVQSRSDIDNTPTTVITNELLQDDLNDMPERDTERLDWLDAQVVAVGNDDETEHVANAWAIDGEYASLRVAIDAEIRAEQREHGRSITSHVRIPHGVMRHPMSDLQPELRTFVTPLDPIANTDVRNVRGHRRNWSDGWTIGELVSWRDGAGNTLSGTVDTVEQSGLMQRVYVKDIQADIVEPDVRSSPLPLNAYGVEIDHVRHEAIITGRMQASLIAYEYAVLRYIVEESGKTLPDNQLVSLLADSVRLAREHGSMDRETSSMERSTEPMQPIYVDGSTVRFRANQICEWLLDNPGRHDLTEIAQQIPSFSAADRRQFAQLIGYSVRGYRNLSYVSAEHYARAERAAHMVQRTAGLTAQAVTDGLRPYGAVTEQGHRQPVESMPMTVRLDARTREHLIDRNPTSPLLGEPLPSREEQDRSTWRRIDSSAQDAARIIRHSIVRHPFITPDAEQAARSATDDVEPTND